MCACVHVPMRTCKRPLDNSTALDSKLEGETTERPPRAMYHPLQAGSPPPKTFSQGLLGNYQNHRRYALILESVGMAALLKLHWEFNLDPRQSIYYYIYIIQVRNRRDTKQVWQTQTPSIPHRILNSQTRLVATVTCHSCNIWLETLIQLLPFFLSKFKLKPWSPTSSTVHTSKQIEQRRLSGSRHQSMSPLSFLVNFKLKPLSSTSPSTVHTGKQIEQGRLGGLSGLRRVISGGQKASQLENNQLLLLCCIKKGQADKQTSRIISRHTLAHRSTDTSLTTK